MGYIYIIKNTINDKVYIGKTTKTILQRFNEHKNQSKYFDYKLYRAMRKYGIDNFYIEKLEECEEDCLNEKEMYWIDFYDSYNNGYNSTLGGDGQSKVDKNEIKKLWDTGINRQEIAKITSIKPDTISKILINNFGITSDEIIKREVKIIMVYIKKY